MSIHAELIYIAEEIAEELGEDHAWVTQLRDLSEEVVDDRYDEANLSWELGKDGVKGFLNQMADITTQAIGVKNLPKYNHNEAIKHRDSIIDAWDSRNKRKADTYNGNKIADSFNLDRFYVWEIINEHENRIAPVSKYYKMSDNYARHIIQDWNDRRPSHDKMAVCTAIAKKYNLDKHEVADVVNSYNRGEIDDKGQRV
jgi:hypothetical protein